MRPAFNEFFALKMNLRMHQNREILIIPLRTGEMNQEPIIFPATDE